MKYYVTIWCDLCRVAKPYKSGKWFKKHLEKKHLPLKIEWYSTTPNTINYT